MNKEKLYFDMLRIRMIEEEISKRYKEGKMRCPVHLSIGQEAAAVGVCAALKPEDKMVSTHRGHAHYLAKGGAVNGLIAELYGRDTGCSRGAGGSMHLISLDNNFWGSTSIVGGTIPYGVGLSFADHLKGNGAYTVVCIGDAAIEEGVFHESANFAALHKLNVIFVCENNLYSCFTHLKNRQPRKSFGKIAKAHELFYFQTHANDVEDIYEHTAFAMKHDGPSFIEIPTYRHLQHCGPDNDDHLGYRGKDEVAAWMALDPVIYNEFNARVIKMEIDAAFDFAERSELAKPVGAYAD